MEGCMGIFLEKNGKSAVCFAVFALGLYLGFEYLLPLAGPFIPAFFVVYLVYPWLGRMQKRLRIRREILLAFFLTAILVLAGLSVWGLLRRSADWVPHLYQNLFFLEKRLNGWLHGGCLFLEKTFGVDAEAAEAVIIERLEVFANQLQVNVWPTAARQSFTYLKKIGAAAAFLGIMFIAALLLCRDFDALARRCRTHPALELLWLFAEKTVKMVGGYLKAQLLIICAVSTAAVAGLWISRIGSPLFWGLLAGILDALPFIGTSVVLLPIALWQLLSGNIWGTAGVVICYILCIAVRELLEPRLLGRQLGVSPVLMLLSVYAGVKVFGITGIFLGPLYVMLLREGCRIYQAREQSRRQEYED